MYEYELCKFIPAVVISILEAVIEFGMTPYLVPEGARIFVCVVVSEPATACPISFPFEINITTHDLTAGRLTAG